MINELVRVLKKTVFKKRCKYKMKKGRCNAIFITNFRFGKHCDKHLTIIGFKRNTTILKNRQNKKRSVYS